MQLFTDILEPGSNDRVVDVGVSDSSYGVSDSWDTGNFFEAWYPGQII
jgi:hypothetical protein